MSSSKHGALYASNHHLGTHREHRLAGARLGIVGVYLDWTVIHGWEATVHIGRVSVKVGMAVSQKDPRLAEWMRHLFPKAELSRGMEDVNNGRMYRGDEDGLGYPMATWRPDDPVQPEGWEHDGTRWVRKTEGWFKDRYGYWRYTEPGEVGWRQKDDLSW